MEIDIAQTLHAPLLTNHPRFKELPPETVHDMEIVSQVFPFRVNNYVLNSLIDWNNPNDPIFRMTFPRREMLLPADFDLVERAHRAGDKDELLRTVAEIRARLNPHPSGQMTANVPRLSDGTRLRGMQHTYASTVLFFPRQAQSCHSFCTFCFRWPQFIGDPSLRIETSEVSLLIRYLGEHEEVSDILFTGGDPFIMKSVVLRRYIDAILEADLRHITTIRFGTKALTYWPYRFTDDDDAGALFDCFDAIKRAGKYPTVVAHFNHPQELRSPPVQHAIALLRKNGIEVRTQTPLLRGINDSPEILSELWSRQVTLGCTPYYLFATRDTGAQHYFGVPLVRAAEIYAEALRSASGLAGTVRGPVMSAHPGKIMVLGACLAGRERVLALKFLQARNLEWGGRLFFARYDPTALWIDDLHPAFNEQRFFFEEPSAQTRSLRNPRGTVPHLPSTLT